MFSLTFFVSLSPGLQRNFLFIFLRLIILISLLSRQNKRDSRKIADETSQVDPHTLLYHILPTYASIRWRLCSCTENDVLERFHPSGCCRPNASSTQFKYPQTGEAIKIVAMIKIPRNRISLNIYFRFSTIAQFFNLYLEVWDKTWNLNLF